MIKFLSYFFVAIAYEIMVYMNITLMVLNVQLHTHLFLSFFNHLFGYFLYLEWKLAIKMMSTTKRNNAMIKKIYSMLVQN